MNKVYKSVVGPKKVHYWNPWYKLQYPLTISFCMEKDLEFKNVKGLEQGFKSSLSFNGATGKHGLVKNCKLFSAAEPNADFNQH